ncbi:hypothetical protein [Actinomadura sp. 6N118]|uniref:hypothetical protein n=1 Tax=Actinomadura sp. 6N118 TaxID=3375151 RepID=UPI003790D8B1
MAKSQHDCLSRSMQEPMEETRTHRRFQAARMAARRIPFKKASSPARAAKAVMASVAAAGIIGWTGTLPVLAQPTDGPPTVSRLALHKQASLSSARPGQRFGYVVQVRNVGMVPAYRAKLTDHMPAGLKVTKVRGPGCRTGRKTVNVTCRWQQVAYRHSVTVRIDVQVSPTVKGGSRLRNRAVLTHPDGRKVATHTMRIVPAKSARSESTAPKSDPDKPAPDKSLTHKPSAHKSHAKESVAHKPATHKSAADRSAGHKPGHPNRPTSHKSTRNVEQLPKTGMPLTAQVSTGLALLLAGGIVCWRARRSQLESPLPQTDEPV